MTQGIKSPPPGGWLAILMVTFCLTMEGQGAGFTTTNQTDLDLAELNLEELLHVKVISVSKRPEDLFRAPAAIQVISQDDIRRQGFTTIADTLRTVPGMEVGQINSHTWAVTARGFNSDLASKLLVLNDGRSVYTPLFAGVYWDVQDMMLEDVERIEVVRGPGATLWGANAVNGVINILSKSARDTQGLLVDAGSGTEEQAMAAVRYGGKIGEQTWFRVYGKYNNHDGMELADGDDSGDDWWISRGGFRIDSEAANGNWLTLQGEIYTGEEQLLFTQPVPASPFTNSAIANNRVFGANLLGRWTYTPSDDAELKLQTYFDHTERESILPQEIRDTFDVELQYRFQPLARNNVVAGVDYRYTADDIDSGPSAMIQPKRRSLNLLSAFIQDEITLIEDRLRVTLGSKFEQNDFTGFEYQPAVRLAWTPTDHQTVWGAVSRAVRTPSRAEDDVQINVAAPSPFPAGTVVSIFGNRDAVSEELLAYELGYRVLPHPRVSLDAAAFYNVYTHLKSLEPTSLTTFSSANGLKGQTYGVEAGADWQVMDNWRLRGSYTWFRMDLQHDGGADPITIPLLEGNSPVHQFSLRSLIDLPHHLELDGGLRYVDDLTSPAVPSYLTMDVRLSWRPRRDLEITLTGLNLLQERHVEFAQSVVDTPQREVERSVYLKVTWRY